MSFAPEQSALGTNDVMPRDVVTSPIIRNAPLRRQQHINAALATALGFAGLVGAIALVASGRSIGWAHVVLFVTTFVPIHLGVTAGFHRLFSHRSYEASPSLRAALAILGSMAGQGPVTFWVALHRLHHEHSDCEGDPHSPNLVGGSLGSRIKGIVYAYIGWTVQHEIPNANHYARDVLRDPMIMWINRHYLYWVALGLAVPAAIGAAIFGGWFGALEGLVWGGALRMFAGHNMIWWITSFAHVFGSRDLESGDMSTNNFWIAIPTLGEGWHNNHHAFPHAASLDFHWWQLDLSGLFIRGCGRLGLAKNIRKPSVQARNARRRIKNNNERTVQ